MKVKSRRMIAWKHFMRRNNGMETASRRNLENDDKAKKNQFLFWKGLKIWNSRVIYIFQAHHRSQKKSSKNVHPFLSISKKNSPMSTCWQGTQKGRNKIFQCVLQLTKIEISPRNEKPHSSIISLLCWCLQLSSVTDRALLKFADTCIHAMFT